MSAESIMPLTFATFFICSVKGLTNLTQRTCVNLLLKGILSEKAKDGGVGVLSEADCSNYAKGKRKLSVDIQIELNELTSEEIINRLKKTGIGNFMTAANALRVLVRNSSLSEKDKEVLLKNYQEDQELKFIAEVFLRSVKEDNRYLLNQEQITTLIKYRDYHALSDDINGTLTTARNQKSLNVTEADLCTETEDKEDISWMGNYLPAAITDKLIISTDREVVMRHDEIRLPEEYPRMIYILKPALREANVRKYSISDFIKTLDIDADSNKLRDGRLEYWQFEGTIVSIASFLKKLNFSDACGFVLQPVGAFEISQIEQIENILKNVSNDNVAIRSPLIYKDVSDFKLVLLVRISKTKAKEQRLDTDHDHTRIYVKERGSKEV